jgi:hypothetical protein
LDIVAFLETYGCCKCMCSELAAREDCQEEGIATVFSLLNEVVTLETQLLQLLEPTAQFKLTPQHVEFVSRTKGNYGDPTRHAIHMISRPLVAEMDRIDYTTADPPAEKTCLTRITCEHCASYGTLCEVTDLEVGQHDQLKHLINQFDCVVTQRAAKHAVLTARRSTALDQREKDLLASLDASRNHEGYLLKRMREPLLIRKAKLLSLFGGVEQKDNLTSKRRLSY